MVDDDGPSRELVTVYLGVKGHQVVACASAEQGLSLVAEQTPDLVLMDICLEGLDGLAAAQILKDDPDTHHIPVIVTTALAMRCDEERVLEKGCDACLVKPLDLSKLADLVRKLKWEIEKLEKQRNADMAVGKFDSRLNGKITSARTRRKQAEEEQDKRRWKR